MTDPTRLLAGLPLAAPDHPDRLRARCHAELDRRHRPAQRGAEGWGWAPWLAGVGLLHLAASIRLALQFAGTF